MSPRIERIQILRRVVIGVPVELEDARELLGGLRLFFFALLAEVVLADLGQFSFLIGVLLRCGLGLLPQYRVIINGLFYRGLFPRQGRRELRAALEFLFPFSSFRF